jgi:hypothetical protein
MRVKQKQCESCGRLEGERHIATTSPPDIDELESWIMDSVNTEATDGCEVEPDGFCEHGHQSWLLIMGMV